MKRTLRQFFRNIFTGRNNVDYSLTKLFGIAAIAVMVYRFVQVPVPDFLGFSGGVASLIAALAAKYYVEGEKADYPSSALINTMMQYKEPEPKPRNLEGE